MVVGRGPVDGEAGVVVGKGGEFGVGLLGRLDLDIFDIVVEKGEI